MASPLGYDFASSLPMPLQGTAAPCPSPARGREMPLLSWPTCLPLGTLSHVSPLQRSSARLKHRGSPQWCEHPAEGTGLAKTPLLGEAPATTQRQWLSREASSGLPAAGRPGQAASLPVPKGRATCSPSTRNQGSPSRLLFFSLPPAKIFRLQQARQPSSIATRPQRLHFALCYLKLKRTRPTISRDAE